MVLPCAFADSVCGYRRARCSVLTCWTNVAGGVASAAKVAWREHPARPSSGSTDDGAGVPSVAGAHLVGGSEAPLSALQALRVSIALGHERAVLASRTRSGHHRLAVLIASTWLHSSYRSPTQSTGSYFSPPGTRHGDRWIGAKWMVRSNPLWPGCSH